MADINNCKLQNIKLTSINFNDNSYKISKNNYTDDLVNSIKCNGIVVPPILLKRDSGYIIIFGHNRLTVLKNSGTVEVLANIINELPKELYISYIQLKNYHNELGIYGKIRMLSILDKFFEFNYRNSLFLHTFQLPDYISDAAVVNRILLWPSNLLDYLDSKNSSFKLLKKMLVLDDSLLKVLGKWLDNFQFRINIFKQVISLLVDLIKIDYDNLIQEILSLGDCNEHDVYIKLFMLRYPEYCKREQQFQRIVKSLKEKGLGVQFPQYYEDNKYSLIFTLKKGEGLEKLNSIVRSVSNEEIIELGDLL